MIAKNAKVNPPWYHRKFVWINLVWFQIIWLIAVVYRENTLLLLLISLALHFLLTPTRRCDLQGVVVITLLGSLADYLLSVCGVLIFANSTFIPLWLILLWSHFALSLNHGMLWLIKLPTYARILFGAIFGTLSYYAGAQLGSVTLGSNLLLSLFSLSVIWAVMLPVYIAVTSFNRTLRDENSSNNT